MIFPKPVIDPDSKVDFYAGTNEGHQMLLPLWEALGERRGTFFASRRVKENGVKLSRVKNILEGFAPLVVADYKSLHDVYVIGEERPFIMFENEHSSKARLMEVVSLFLCREQRTVDLRRVIADDVIKIEDEQDAANKLLAYLKGNEVKHITEIQGYTIGMMYMAWGEKAMQSINRSIATLKRLGYSYPVAIVGDFPNKPPSDVMPSTRKFIPMDTNPFDVSKAKNFQFRAGRIKPQLCKLSPFDFTLYVDADTQFIQPVHLAFHLLFEHDLVVTDEILSLKDLYNKRLAGWELNMIERDVTIIELGGNDQQKFINSGVFLFRKNEKTIKLFNDWSEEWQRFQEWDEQLALMRAIHENDVNVHHLPVEWNSPRFTKSTIIFHDYGRGSVRMNG